MARRFEKFLPEVKSGEVETTQELMLELRLLKQSLDHLRFCLLSSKLEADRVILEDLISGIEETIEKIEKQLGN